MKGKEMKKRKDKAGLCLIFFYFYVAICGVLGGENEQNQRTLSFPACVCVRSKYSCITRS